MTVAAPEPWALPTPELAVPRESPFLWYARVRPSVVCGLAAPPPGFEFDWLVARGVREIVSLVGEPPYDPAPLTAHAFELHDLVGGGVPTDPDREGAELHRAAVLVRALARRDVGVAVHCGAGIGRTGAVIGSVLVAEGIPAARVTTWLDEVQRRRGAPGWPESRWHEQHLDVLVR